MARFGLALIYGVCLAAGCGKSDAGSTGASDAGSGGRSATGGLGAASGAFQTSGNGGSLGLAGSGGSASVAGAAGHAGSGGIDGTGGAPDGADAGSGGLEAAGGSAGAAEGCPPTLPLRCGDSVDHSTLIQGRPNTWSAYSSTQRAETGRETIYSFVDARECAVVATLQNLTTDLDLLLVPTCDSISSQKASSTPLDIQTVETVGWTNPAGKAIYLAVDGYAGAEGTYTLEVWCTCQASLTRGADAAENIAAENIAAHQP